MLFGQAFARKQAQEFARFDARAGMVLDHFAPYAAIFAMAQNADSLAGVQFVAFQIVEKRLYLLLDRLSRAGHKTVAHDAVNERRVYFAASVMFQSHTFHLSCAASLPVENAICKLYPPVSASRSSTSPAK